MTYEEIANLYFHDCDTVVAGRRNALYPSICRLARKQESSRTMTKTVEFDTKAGFHFVMTLMASKWSIKKNFVLRFTYAWYFTERGRTVIASSNVKDGLTEVKCRFLTQHLFERYRERFLHNPFMPMDDVVRYFMQRNYNMSMMTYAKEELRRKYKHIDFCACYDGLCGYEMVIPWIALIKTYISRDLIRNEQHVIDEKGHEYMMEGLTRLVRKDVGTPYVKSSLHFKLPPTK